MLLKIYKKIKGFENMGINTHNWLLMLVKIRILAKHFSYVKLKKPEFLFARRFKKRWGQIENLPPSFLS